jgi:hypothetical protein
MTQFRRVRDHDHPVDQNQSALTGKNIVCPPPADYSEDVSDEYLDAIERILASEWEGQTFVQVSGPAW